MSDSRPKTPVLPKAEQEQGSAPQEQVDVTEDKAQGISKEELAAYEADADKYALFVKLSKRRPSSRRLPHPHDGPRSTSNEVHPNLAAANGSARAQEPHPGREETKNESRLPLRQRKTRSDYDLRPAAFEIWC